MSATDTIIALSTPPGISALAIVRLSGPDVVVYTNALLAAPREWTPQHAVYVHLRDQGQLLDEAVATYWKGPHSFTGEDTMEISCHGNPLIAQNILQAFIHQGARPAEPGEFTQRAFLNGKLDLTQAEAVLDLIHASTERALVGAQAMKEGRLAEKLNQLRHQLIDLLAHLEAYIDFPEEDIEPETGETFLGRIDTMRQEVIALLQTAPLGRILREGITTAIVGAPNVGKSSLLNALLHESRAIVSATPGTTRDTIEAECNVRGFRLLLVDTAGQRETHDEIEAEGVRRAQSVAQRADLILHVFEAPHALTAFDAELQASLQDRLYLPVANKVDLGRHPDHQNALAVSTRTSQGLAELEDAIEKRLIGSQRPADTGWLTINARQEAALHRAEEALGRAASGLTGGLAPELISIDLRAALNEIGQIVGLATNEDILDQLFKNFCIGK
ncbi:MAG: tRNA uridine-5-carboxymethylaminomethyl(34) synthesis GTPase MnmE [Verrucomicrobia bacterium Tous-C9LFEB]|nr:MAG: tRNA uridine-5-carboxymethylaminomethyl(34) synthesis GTPase MnmE [Verrucomicrobia bacterium Tous-C9LFEB]